MSEPIIFNPDDPCCVECGEPMMLSDGCEWSDNPNENICHLCTVVLLKKAEAELAEVTAYVSDLESAIKQALDDEESGNGWGPDVTVCAYLQAALEKRPNWYTGGEP